MQTGHVARRAEIGPRLGLDTFGHHVDVVGQQAFGDIECYPFAGDTMRGEGRLDIGDAGVIQATCLPGIPPIILA